MRKSKMGLLRLTVGMTAIEFARKLQEAGLKNMTESRVCRIETGRSPPTEIERATISRLLNVKPWEINL